jgi:hypothetical protein
VPPPAPTPNGIIVYSDLYSAELAVEGSSAFRVSLLVGGGGGIPKAISSPMIVSKKTHASHVLVKHGNTVGIKTSFGSVTINQHSGALELTDAKSKLITSMSGPSTFSRYLNAHALGTGNHTDACTTEADTDYYQPGQGPTAPATSAAACCTICEEIAQKFFVWQPSGKCYCKPNGQGKRHSPGNTAGKCGPPTPTPGMMTLAFTSASDTKLYGSGAGKPSSHTLSRTGSNPHVQNTETFVPYYYSTDGYSALGVSRFTDAPHAPPGAPEYPASYTKPGSTIKWNIMSHDMSTNATANADIYLMPASSLKQGTSAYYALTGNVPLLPRYSFGFLACRWGEG